MNIMGTFTEETIDRFYKINKENKELQKEIERLNNIINELEKWLIMFNETHKNDTALYSNWLRPREILNKLNELKEK